MSILKTTMAMLAALALAAPLLAADPEAGVNDLKAAKQNVASAAAKADGQARQALLQELNRLDTLIKNLEAGELGQTRQGPPSVR